MMRMGTAVGTAVGVSVGTAEGTAFDISVFGKFTFYRYYVRPNSWEFERKRERVRE